MKKFTKVALVLFAVCLALGIGFVSAGIALGATVQSIGEVWNTSALHRFWHNIDDGDDWEYAEDFIDTYVEETLDDYEDNLEEAMDDYEDGLEETLIQQTTDTHHETHHTTDDGWIQHRFGNVEELSVDLAYGQLFLEETTDADVQIEIYGDINGKIQVKQDGQELKIKGEKIKSLKDVSIYVYLPENIVLKEIKVQTGAGTVVADYLRASELEVEIGAGVFEGTNTITAEESKWSVGTGQIVVGMLDGQEIEFSCGMGTIEASLVGIQEDYSCDLEVGVGNLTIGDDSYSGLGREKTIRSGPRNLEIECGMGNVEIIFAEG